MKNINYIVITMLLAWLCSTSSAQIDTSITATYSGPIYSGYTSQGCSGGCIYNLPLVLPPRFTITGVRYWFNYRVLGGCNLTQGGFNISLGSCSIGCRSCLVALPGLCQSDSLPAYKYL